MIAYISIGNSGDKLPQRMWVAFQLETKMVIQSTTALIHGEWHSAPDTIYQNACYCIDISPDEIPELKGTLAGLAKEFNQDSIAWAEAPVTEFLGAAA